MRLDERQLIAGPTPVMMNGTTTTPAVATGRFQRQQYPAAHPGHPHAHTMNGSELVMAHPNGNGIPSMRMPHSGSGLRSNSVTTATSATSTLSSLGYISDDSIRVNSDPIPPSHAHNMPPSSLSSWKHHQTPRSKSSMGAYSSLGSHSAGSLGVGGVASRTGHTHGHSDYMVAPYIPKSRSHDNLQHNGFSSSAALRPTSLGIPLEGGAATNPQSILCPNCKRSFAYSRAGQQGNAFGPWFEHIKQCTA